MKRMLEICVDGLPSVISAAENGADRIELCEQLDVGGVTPHTELIQKVMRSVGMPVHVLVRLRAGDLHYTEKEISQMSEDISMITHTGVAGVVIGALDRNGEVDVVATKRMIDAAKGIHITFHRAFDHIRNMRAALDILMDLGVQRVLTAGGIRNACDNVHVFQELVDQSDGRIEVMPGGGIRPNNIGPLLSVKGIYSFHSAATSGSAPGADAGVVAELREMLDR